MATTSIWRVKGWLGKVVVYVENPNKTDNPAFVNNMNLSEQQKQELTDVIEYAVNSIKTQTMNDEHIEHKRSFVSGINCDPHHARDEMLAVKQRFSKENGTVAYHGYQSFGPGEVTPELAHEIGVKLATRLWGERYQVLVATHLDKSNHLHNHFVMNTVSFEDGIKYHRTNEDYLNMRRISDELCREYGLSVIENPQNGRSKHYGEWNAEHEQRPTWRSIVRTDVDEAIRQSMTESQFFDNLRKKGYAIKVGKDISVRPPAKERFVRLQRNFGEDYSIDRIRRRILTQLRTSRSMLESPPTLRKSRITGNLKYVRKITGFRALYFHYCYLLGIFPKTKPRQNKKLHFLLREDLIRMDLISQEANLLARNQIETAMQLASHRENLEMKIKSLTDERSSLYRLRRTVAVKEDAVRLSEVKAKISSLSKEISSLREEVRLCEDIESRSGVIKEKMKVVREDNTSEREEHEYEQFRRRGRASR